MKRPKSDSGGDNSFLFQVDILVSAETNGAALERLLHVLNAGDFEDFRVGSGIQLGRVIEEALAYDKKAAVAVSPEKARVNAAVAKAKEAVAGNGAHLAAAPKTQANASKSAASTSAPDEMEQRIQQYIKTNKLIRLNVNKGRGVKLSIPCRIIGYDKSAQLITVYHVDEKQVHSLKLFEIDDFVG